MVIGGTPDEDDEKNNTVFGGPVGKLLRIVLSENGVKSNEVYFSNLTACRSCTPITNGDGTPRLFPSRNGHVATIRYKEEDIPKEAAAECLKRLHEEIYLVDPLLILGLGNDICRALSHTMVNTDAPAPEPPKLTIEVPGASHRAILTEKKGAWVRKVRGTLNLPTEQNTVKYVMVALRSHRQAYLDQSNESSVGKCSLFMRDVGQAVRLFRAYQEELHEPAGTP